jgi:hypothetical protein
MANVTITRGTTLPDSSSKTDFHNLVDGASGTVTNIVNADIDSAANIADTKLATISTPGKVSPAAITGTLIFSKGADIASATTTDIGAATGNCVDVTGTTTITGLGTIAAGALRFVRFTGALLLTHNGTSLILPTGANITTAAGDTATFESLGSGNWVCLSYQRKDGTPLAASSAGSVVAVSNYQRTDKVDCATNVPVDNNTRTSSEGNQVLTVNHTPASNSNKLLIEVHINYGCANATNACAILMNGTTVLATGRVTQPTNGGQIFVRYMMSTPGTSQITFNVNFGGSDGATVYCNGAYNGASSLDNGKYTSSITVTEIKG